MRVVCLFVCLCVMPFMSFFSFSSFIIQPAISPKLCSKDLVMHYFILYYHIVLFVVDQLPGEHGKDKATESMEKTIKFVPL